ncbi:hypothetical protein LJB88_00525 [Erysipelotrichaceae bacterium OttesenSCG-928-M19]|nr:hypothetical protein [Erysipelotrichaceae bacterium OttesenSCG-928-M19]
MIGRLVKIIIIFVFSTLVFDVQNKEMVIKANDNALLSKERDNNYYTKGATSNSRVINNSMANPAQTTEELQKIISKANNGDIIYIASMTLTETITIDKSITIVGQSKKVTIVGLTAKNSRHFIVTKTVDVTLRNFQLVGSKKANKKKVNGGVYFKYHDGYNADAKIRFDSMIFANFNNSKSDSIIDIDTSPASYVSRKDKQAYNETFVELTINNSAFVADNINYNNRYLIYLENGILYLNNSQINLPAFKIKSATLI